ncbi:hypothetical protein B484DRAFT_389100, partial [Ochromonadaceae sp. CCMP2298]
DSAGAACLIFGKAGGFVTLDLASFTSSDSTGYVIQGAEVGDEFGYSVSAAGDVDGNGYADVIVGALYARRPAVPSSQRSGQLTASPSTNIEVSAQVQSTVDLASFVSGDSTGYVVQDSRAGNSFGNYLGGSVSAAGDVNSDGYGDFIVSAQVGDDRYTGAAYVILGKAGGFSSLDLAGFTSSDSTGYVIQGAEVGDEFGYSVSAAGDVNGDGYADVIVGAPGADPNGRSSAGAAYLILGKAGGFSSLDLAGFNSSDSTGYIIQGAVVNDYLGTSVSAAGDVNGDGYAD